MSSRPRVLSPRHAKRARVCNATRSARREVAKNRVRHAFQEIGNIVREEVPIQFGCNGSSFHTINHGDTRGVNDENNGHSTLRRIVSPEGNYDKVEKGCLSISHVYCNQESSIALSMLPIRSGKCLMHNLGKLDYVCQNCQACCWKVEGKTISNFIGRYCCGVSGKRLLPLLSPPHELQVLMEGNTVESRQFLQNIRAYNSVLAFASLGAHIDDRFMRGGGVYSFRVHGQTYHSIGSLMPNEQSHPMPRFAQLYFYDTEHELQNRLQCVSNLNENILRSLQDMMHRCNPYALMLRAIGVRQQNSNSNNISMVIKENRASGWQYIAPRGTEVAAIMPGNGEDTTIGHRDILINMRDGELKRISNTHRSYMSLLYVLLFPRGEDGWDLSMDVTQKEYYTFRLQVRHDTSRCLLRGGRLLQQYIVDAYSSMEESRLVWIKNHQDSIRAEVYAGLVDMVHMRDRSDAINGREAGRRIVLPSSFVGGPRYMHQLYQDSMAIVRKKGKPDLFITFTCNPQWREISDALLPGQNASDRPDLVSRVFYHKFRDMMSLLIKRSIFGDVEGHVSVIEFQKRGLPHAHILIILANRFKPTELTDYDRLVCAELPDKDAFPELYEIIRRSNVHGPCGNDYPKCPCMIEGKCRFKYPRRFCASTALDSNGYPTYMRRDDGKFVTVKGKRLDNRWVVPYNPFLSMRYKAHINVEVCSTISAVKYLYKYLYKGHDRATIVMQAEDNAMDEIKRYLDARYVSSSEAIWRIYGFDMHNEKPDVQRLHVHLPMQNMVTFHDMADLRGVIENDVNKRTTLTEWFATNQNEQDANELLYIDFPEKWVWHSTRRCWAKRQRGNSIGRIYNVLPNTGELYFLRMLLTVCKGSKSFEDLRTVNGNVYPTFKDACNARGLLQSDEEWMMCLDEASFVRTGAQLRELFAIILIYCMPIAPQLLWERFSEQLSEDFYHVLESRDQTIDSCCDVAKKQALVTLERLLKVHGKSLSDFPGMPQLHRSDLQILENSFLLEEKMYNAQHELDVALEMERELNVGQRFAYFRVLEVATRDASKVFFLDGPGGSGKTYVYNALLSRIRGAGKIALACASSGIAALLLKNGRTAHSRFKIPINVDGASTCNINVNSNLAELLRQARLIVWDEAPMIHRHAFEALDRTLRDIMQKDFLFGGKTILLGGDFRQVLPVVLKGRREDMVGASLCNSFMWKDIEVLKLTENMRLVNSSTLQTEREFAKWILDVGNGDVHADVNSDDVVIPSTMLLDGNSIESLIHHMYGSMSFETNLVDFFKDRGILASRNKEVDMVNQLTLEKLVGPCKEYLSADSICSSDNQLHQLYTVEFLNALDLGGGYPQHALRLKENAPVMLLRNLDPRRGLCNGTRLLCRQLYERVIEAEIITGNNVGNIVFIPRIDFISGSSLGLPFEMRRRQFPLKLAFGMTINKAQGQTLGTVGLYLPSPVFSHGQLYVALSRAKSSGAIKVIVGDQNQQRRDGVVSTIARTSNIVYKEVLQLTTSLPS